MAMETATVLASVPAATPAPVKIERDTRKWLRKTRLCAYSLEGACRFGSKCNFAHSAAEVQAAPNLSKTQLCPAYAAGSCSMDNCSFAHGLEKLLISPNSKSKICKWFAKGMCRSGSKCSFAHGTDQLRGEPRTNAEGQPRAISPPPGLSLAAPEVKAPILLELEDCLRHVKVPTKAPVFLGLQSSILNEKEPPSSLELQLEGMAAQITALLLQIHDMEPQHGRHDMTEVSSMKKVLEELTVQCAGVQHSLDQTAPILDTIGVSACPEKTPRKAALSNTAAPFQPDIPSTWSPHTTPCLLAKRRQHLLAKRRRPRADETYWQSDDSTSIGSGGLF